jgi:hypothetical protein
VTWAGRRGTSLTGAATNKDSASSQAFGHACSAHSKTSAFPFL